jgi:tRNA pseudouridine38-40 synthase
MRLAYDGTRFSGWQSQPNNRTVQGELAAALGLLFAQPVCPTGAGRTDGGVHAVAQTAHFDIDNPRVPIDRLVPALRGRMSREIRVIEAAICPDAFHACYDAVRRSYRYRFVTGTFLPHQRDYAALFPWRFDAQRLAAALAPLAGRHDFSSFCLADSDARTRIRCLQPVKVLPSEAGFDLEFTADGFLRKMIRLVTGTLREVYPAADPGRAMEAVLAARDVSAAGPPAPPGGLYLCGVDYPEDFE